MGRKGRRIIAALLLAGMLVSAVSLGAGTACMAQETSNATDAAEGSYGWVQDGAGLLDADEVQELDEACAEVSAKYGAGVYIVTTDDFGGGDIKDWQRSVFDKYDLGLGENNSGIMMAVSMAGRDWGIVGFGDAQPAFTTYGRERIGGLVVDDLSDGDYYDAFSKYVSLADEFMEAETEGAPYSEDNPYKESVSIGLIIVLSFALSFVVSLIIVLVWKKGMDTRVLQDSANEYMKKDSFKLTRSSDVFLYRTVSRTERPKDIDRRGNTSSDSSGTSGKF